LPKPETTTQSPPGCPEMRHDRGELLGRIHDLEHDLPEDGIQRTITENHTLRAQVRQLTQDSRRPEERLAVPATITGFLTSEIADLEAQLA
jgi:hypothetical protein